MIFPACSEYSPDRDRLDVCVTNRNHVRIREENNDPATVPLPEPINDQIFVSILTCRFLSELLVMVSGVA